MTDTFWIVSSHDFVRHKTAESALAEAARLAKLTGHPFLVYGVGEKSSVPPPRPEQRGRGRVATEDDPIHKGRV